MSGRIEFANSLRGVASMLVMLGHYIFVFHFLGGAYGGMTKLPEPVFPRLSPLSDLGIANFSFGAFGVALFFMVSGFVIPFSLTKFSKYRFGSLRFLVARAFRLWPVYLVGFTISMVFRWISFSGSEHPESYKVSDLLLHVTFFRDWFGGRYLDGVGWTLEVEVKFYLLSALLAAFTLRGRPVLPVVAGCAAIAGAYWNVKLPQGWMPPSNFLYAAKYVLFMTLGTQFFLVMRKVISRRTMLLYSAATLALFMIVAGPVIRESYLLAFLVFSISYLGRDGFGSNRLLGFFANISYPLYAVHAIFGYVTMRLMIDAGLPKHLALVVQICLTCLLAYLIHRFVEVPSQRLGSKVSVMKLPAWGSRSHRGAHRPVASRTDASRPAHGQADTNGRPGTASAPRQADSAARE